MKWADGVSDVEIVIPSFLRDGEGNLHDLESEITERDFLNRINPILDQTIDCVMRALIDASMTIDDINRILLVGSATKADWVINTIKGKLHKQPIRAENTDSIIAQGAAFYGF